MGVAAGKPSLLTVAKDYIRQQKGKTGNVYLGIVSRLDAPVTGVVLMARTSKAAARLTRQFHDREVDKAYWAIVAGHLDESSGQCEDWLCKHQRHRRVQICREEDEGAQQARLRWSTLELFEEHTMLQIHLETGRKHQIRVQLSHRGHPILGDRKYDSEEAFDAGIALHARKLVLEHPTLKTEVAIECPPPKSWNKWV